MPITRDQSMLVVFTLSHKGRGRINGHRTGTG
jgi:hypothetical protein